MVFPTLCQFSDGTNNGICLYKDINNRYYCGVWICFVQVLRDIDASGFYFGELRGKQGLIPSNLVKRVAFESEDRREEAVVIIDTHGRHTVPQREVTASTSLTRIGSLTPISEQDMLSPSHNAMVGLSGRSADRHQRDGVVEEVQPEAISRHPGVLSSENC